MDHFDITIIGAGVVGLAVADAVTPLCPHTLVIEKNKSFGQETSSRNSEVIHSGIYYPAGSLKTATCIEGRRLLYAFCRQHHIPHAQLGKCIVACNREELKALEDLFARGQDNGVEDLRLLSRQELGRLQPHVKALGAIHSPVTGILDTHALMMKLEERARSRGGTFAYATTVTGIDRKDDAYEVRTSDTRGEEFCFLSRRVINCAGLYAGKVAALAGIDKEEYRIKYCKGDYFRVHHNKGKYISSLIYPVPHKAGAGLGIHATLDLAGGLRLGPDDRYVEEISYDVDPAKAAAFYESARMFLPFIEPGDLLPDTCGIRPKLQGPGEDFRDFIVKEEFENGLPGLINLIGIESPGLTASFSIAKMVRGLMQKN